MTERGGRWTRYARMRGAGWTMLHFLQTDAHGYFTTNACGYDPHRGLKRPAMVRLGEPVPGAPRCSRCEKAIT